MINTVAHSPRSIEVHAGDSVYDVIEVELEPGGLISVSVNSEVVTSSVTPGQLRKLAKALEIMADAADL